MNRSPTSLLSLTAPGIAILFAVCALGGCGNSPHAVADVPQAPPIVTRLVHQSAGVKLLQVSGQLPGMTLTRVRAAELPGVLETNGQIAFDEHRVANVVSRVTGRIERVYVSQWDNVRRGQPIVTLYSPDYMTAEAEYLQAKQTVSVLGAGGTGNAEFARSLVEAARRKLELLGIERGQIAAIKSAAPFFTMMAPISGIVVENKAQRGSAINPGDVLYSVGTLGDVWVIASIYEDDLSRVHVGQKLEAITTAFPNRVFAGFVSRVSPDINPDTHTLQIRCQVANPGALLKPHMLARVRIVTRPGTALVVPQEALVFDTNRYFAFVEVRPGLFERRAVNIASWREAGYTRVIAGLKPGNRVVVKGSIQINALWNQANGNG